METNKQRARPIALGGILLALLMGNLMLAGTLPSFELTLYAFSSLFSAIMILETGMRNGWIFFFAAVLLAFLLLPNKIAILPYVFFFGPYGPVKYHIESIRNRIGELVLKLLFFNGSVAMGYLIFGELFFRDIGIPAFPLPLLIPAAQLFFLLYDAIFTHLIQYYRRRLRPDNRNGGDR
ncbi:MAG: hypothetical protein CVU86_05460 [Firmicutes bacterium HGW-Firmicutes-11]|jgi:hypothetical protein|nr:MAG: hypothetical protein CVU86_05460 [Firmicutes bacterium HGW-Firmicutes-11]